MISHAKHVKIMQKSFPSRSVVVEHCVFLHFTEPAVDVDATTVDDEGTRRCPSSWPPPSHH